MADGSGVGPLSWNPLQFSVPRALLGSLLVVTAIALVVAASTSGAAFGAYNPAWDGASNLRDEAAAVNTESTLALNTTAYEGVQANETVSVVISPDRPYSEQEAARLRRFVEDGGTLVVAEDFGNHSNALLAAVGASARFDGALVRDERYNYRSPAMPVARNVSSYPLLTGVDRLTLNHGTVVEPNDASAVVDTSGYAYLDRNRNGELDDDESLGTYTVMTVEPIGEGRVIAVSDPSLFINAMLERSGNEQFVANTFGAHELVLLDYSHADRLPPLSLALVVVRKTPLLQVLVVGVGLVVVGAWGQGRLGRLLGRLSGDAPVEGDVVGENTGVTRENTGELRAYLRRRHPDWDEGRIERLVRRVDREDRGWDRDRDRE